MVEVKTYTLTLDAQELHDLIEAALCFAFPLLCIRCCAVASRSLR